MNKIESARIIAEFNGECIKVLCAECFNREVCTKLYEDGKDAESSHKLALAEAYIKRHEGKSRKKDHIRDAKKKVEEPIKINIWVQSLFDIDGLIKRGESVPASRETAKQYYFEHIDKWYTKDLFRMSDFKPVEEPTPLEIAKMIRDNGYSCLGLIKNCPPCPLWGKGGCGTSDKIVEENHIKRKQLIDNYISAKEPKPVKKVGVDNDDVTLARPTVKENLSVPCEHLINADSCGNAF